MVIKTSLLENEFIENRTLLVGFLSSGDNFPMNKKLENFFYKVFIMTKSPEQNQTEHLTEKGIRKIVEFEGGGIFFDDMLI